MAPATDVYLVVASDQGNFQFSERLPVDMTIEVGGLTDRDITNVIELAVGRACKKFIREYMPLRFHGGYARRELGWKVLPSTWSKKLRRSERHYADAVLPNVWTGKTRSDTLAGSYVETKAIGGRTKGHVSAVIRIPVPSYVNAQRSQITNKCLYAITAREAEMIARTFFAEVVAIMSTATTRIVETRGGKLVPRTTLSGSDVAAFGMTSRATILASRKGAASGAA